MVRNCRIYKIWRVGGEKSEIQTNESLYLKELWIKIDEVMYNRGKTTGLHWIKEDDSGTMEFRGGRGE